MTSKTKLLAALAIAGAVVGCTPRSSPAAHQTAPVATERRLANLQNVASRHTSCPAREIEVRQVAEQVFTTRGCGVVREYALMQRGRSAEWQPITPVNLRAANEMACPLERLVIAAPVENVREVSGCGRSAQYQLACGPAQCEWAMIGHGSPQLGDQGIHVTPPGVGAPAPVSGGSGVRVVPPPQQGGVDPVVDQTIRRHLDAQRDSIMSCVPRGQGALLRAQWGGDGMVRLSLDPPWQGTQSERCVQSSVGQLQVTTGQPGALTHMVQ